ncbi:hypothetical protein H0E87_017410 [Populus deltoides]|uniref:Uncharacterized protein n=1 Tax=Populus deltoides TaxID=3696 RepID=A0A8T2Y064_POPDE|nr:hypothetical protein H0E87_017410 [Populus deltoides]
MDISTNLQIDLCRDPIGTTINLSTELWLGIGLFRLATGSSYIGITDRFGVTESVNRFCAKQLCSVSCTNLRSRVGFPSPTELVKRNDCKSASNDEVQDDSIAFQIVVDSSSRILSVVAGFRGDKEGSRILKPTTLCHDAEGRRLLNSTFLVHLHAFTFRALCLKRTLYQSFLSDE